MAAHNETGRKGEDAAALYLARLGYTLRERNWQSNHLEVDIIAEYRGMLIFVEVKTSKRGEYGDPSNRVDLKKRVHLIKAANAYIRYHRLIMNARFDVISVVGKEEPFTITHIKNAFTVEGTKVAQGY